MHIGVALAIGLLTTLGLAVRMASEGFIVVAVDHHGNTAAERATHAAGFVRWHDRPLDVSILIDRILSDPDIGPRVDPDRIGVGGFSLGGYTALATAGLRIHIDAWITLCRNTSDDPMCRVPPEASFADFADFERLVASETDARVVALHRVGFRDRRVKAVMALAPVGGSLMSDTSAGAIDVPVSVIAGSDDDQSPPNDTAAFVDLHVPHSRVDVLFGGTIELGGKIKKAANLSDNYHII